VRPEDVLLMTAQLGVAIAGFSSVASAVSDRQRAAGSARRRFANSVLVTSSISAVAWSVIPLVLISAEVAADVVWQIASAGWVAFQGGAAVYRLRETRELGGAPSLSARVFLAPLSVCVALQLWNAVGSSQAWPHLVGVVFSLFVAMVSFFLLAHDDEGAAG
jgi:hypothetical protein